MKARLALFLLLASVTASAAGCSHIAESFRQLFGKKQAATPAPPIVGTPVKKKKPPPPPVPSDDGPPVVQIGNFMAEQISIESIFTADYFLSQGRAQSGTEYVFIVTREVSEKEEEFYEFRATLEKTGRLRGKLQGLPNITEHLDKFEAFVAVKIPADPNDEYVVAVDGFVYQAISPRVKVGVKLAIPESISKPASQNSQPSMSNPSSPNPE